MIMCFHFILGGTSVVLANETHVMFMCNCPMDCYILMQRSPSGDLIVCESKRCQSACILSRRTISSYSIKSQSLKLNKGDSALNKKPAHHVAFAVCKKSVWLDKMNDHIFGLFLY